MLITGTLNKDVLTTEMGEFKVSRKGEHQIHGVFDIETIKGESIEQTVDVNGMTFKVQVPITKAKIKAIYTLLTKESQQDQHQAVENDLLVTEEVCVSNELSKEEQATKDLYLGNLSLLDNANIDKEMELFGRPLKNMQEFSIDCLLSRDVIKEQGAMLRARGFVFDSSTQTYTRG